MRRLTSWLTAVFACFFALSGCAIVPPAELVEAATAPSGTKQDMEEAGGADPETGSIPARTDSGSGPSDPKEVKSACDSISTQLASVYTGLQSALAEAPTNPKRALVKAKNQVKVLDDAIAKAGNSAMKSVLAKLRSSLVSVIDALGKGGSDPVKLVELSAAIAEAQQNLTDLQATCAG